MGKGGTSVSIWTNKQRVILTNEVGIVDEMEWGTDWPCGRMVMSSGLVPWEQQYARVLTLEKGVQLEIIVSIFRKQCLVKAMQVCKVTPGKVYIETRVL